MATLPNLLTIPTRAVGTADPAGDMNAVVIQLNQMLAYIRALASELRPDLQPGITGSGTVADPYTHPDGTAGIQTLINTLPAGGGKIKLVSKVFKITKPILITNPAIVIEGEAPAFFIDPNGESKPQVGCLLDCTCTAFRLGIGDKTDANGNVTSPSAQNRIGGVKLKGVAFWGPGITAHTADNDKVPCVEVVGCGDQWEFDNLYIGNFEEGIAYTNRNGGGNLDSPTFNRIDVVACRRGIVNRTGLLCVFERITNCVLSDVEEWGLDLYGTSANSTDPGQPQQSIVSGTLFVRCGRGGGNTGGVRLRGQGHFVFANIFRDSGWHFINGTKVAADGIVNEADGANIFGNSFRGTKYGAGIRNRGHGCKISLNDFDGNFGDISNGRPEVFSAATNFSTNQYDVYNEMAAVDAVITQPGYCNAVDYGVRTNYNGEGVSAADPDDQNGSSPWRFIINKPYQFRIFNTGASKRRHYSPNYANGYYDETVAANTSTGPTPAPGSTQVEWFKFVDTSQSTSGGQNILEKTSGVDAYAMSGAAGRTMVGTPSDTTKMAAELAVSIRNLYQPTNAHFIGLTKPGDLGTPQSGNERVYEMQYAAFYDGQNGGRYTFFYNRGGTTISNGTVYDGSMGAGKLSIRPYANHVDFCFNDAVIETYTVATPFPLVPDCRISELNNTIVGVTLASVQNALQTPN